MKRSEMLQTKLNGALDALQMCRDIVEGNINAMKVTTFWEPGCIRDVDLVELEARIFTDFEILAMNQEFVQGRDCGDESDAPR